MIAGLIARSPRLSGWFYGFRAPERGTVVLSHRRVYILPARLGLLFVGTVLILLVGSVNYALSLGFALAFILGGAGLVGMVHTTRNLARIAISVGRAEPVFAGEAAQFRLYLDGRSDFDRPAILVRHVASRAQLVVDVPAGAGAEVVLGVPARRRGWLPIGRVMLETRFPLGMFRAWSYVEAEARCLVYPRPERSPLPPPSTRSDAGSTRVLALGNEDFSGLRAYQRADSPRHVAWKAVARSDSQSTRTDDMLTKQFSGEAAVEFWLDWSLLPAGLGEEQRLSRLAGWVIAAERDGARYGLRLPGAEIAPAAGDAHHTACLQALALYGTHADRPRGSTAGGPAPA